MKYFYITVFILIFILSVITQAQNAVHVWEKQELTFTAASTYRNAYTDLVVWVDLTGPGFKKRIYGFWDGGQVFHLRLLATAPGTWTWESGSSPADPGLTGKTGSFTAAAWTEAELDENPLRRGMIRATANHHALQYADGTPYLAIGDTWYSVPANRFKWYDDDRERPIGPTAGFKDYVRYRQAQGYNWINVIAAFPNWKTDDKPWRQLPGDRRLEYGRLQRYFPVAVSQFTRTLTEERSA